MKKLIIGILFASAVSARAVELEFNKTVNLYKLRDELIAQATFYMYAYGGFKANGEFVYRGTDTLTATGNLKFHPYTSVSEIPSNEVNGSSTTASTTTLAGIINAHAP